MYRCAALHVRCVQPSNTFVFPSPLLSRMHSLLLTGSERFVCLCPENMVVPSPPSIVDAGGCAAARRPLAARARYVVRPALADCPLSLLAAP